MGDRDHEGQPLQKAISIWSIITLDTDILVLTDKLQT